MKMKTLFVAGVIIGTVSFSGTSCISHNPQAAATNTEQSDSMNVVQVAHVPEMMEFVPGEWSKNPRLLKSLITDFEPREAVKRVRNMIILPDTMDHDLLDLSPYKIVITPDKDYKLIFPTNSVLSVNGDTANGTTIDSAVSDSIFYANEEYHYKIRRARGMSSYEIAIETARKPERNVDYSLIGSVNLCPGVKSYIMSGIWRQTNSDFVYSTVLYLVNCVDNRIISMLELAEDWNDGLGVMSKQAYRIPDPAGRDIILTKMVSYPTDIEPFDDRNLHLTYSAYKLNDSGELHRIYKP